VNTPKKSKPHYWFSCPHSVQALSKAILPMPGHTSFLIAFS
jgi:hypothetical protein